MLLLKSPNRPTYRYVFRFWYKIFKIKNNIDLPITRFIDTLPLNIKIRF